MKITSTINWSFSLTAIVTIGVGFWILFQMFWLTAAVHANHEDLLRELSSAQIASPALLKIANDPMYGRSGKLEFAMMIGFCIIVVSLMLAWIFVLRSAKRLQDRP